MSVYEFTFNNNAGLDGTSDDIKLIVNYDDHNGGNLDNVVGALVQFLYGVGFTRHSIQKYINHELV